MRKFCNNCIFCKTARNILSDKKPELYLYVDGDYILQPHNIKWDSYKYYSLENPNTIYCTYNAMLEIDTTNVVNETYKVLINSNYRELNKTFNCLHYHKKSILHMMFIK